MALDNTPNIKVPPPPNPTPRIVAVLFLVALLAFAFFKGRGRTANDNAANTMGGVPGVNIKAALDRYGFALQEVSKQAGINFTHTPPTLDAKLNHIMPEIAAMGASVSVVDFDRDGWNDLYVCDSKEGGQNHLYRNNHDGTFTDVAAQMGVADLNQKDTGACMGAVWGDFDNDGYEDLLVYKWGRCELFHNDGGKHFTRITDTAGLPPHANINSAIWLDYDRDGHLDLLLCGYYPDDVDLWHLKNTHMMPDSFEFAKNGGRKYLLRGRGDGTFEDVTAKMGIDSHRWTLAATAADLTGSGYPDIVLANDYGVAEVYINHAGRHFEEAADKTIYGDRLGRGAKSGMNASVGDILNQGRFAFYISNISEQGQLLQGNDLWVPDEQKPAPGTLPRYTNMAHDMGVELGGWSFGAQFGDLNNDGKLDLYLTNGFISADRQQTYWYEFSKVSGANSTIIGDAANWPALGNRSHSGYQSKRVWMGDGLGKFTEVARQVGATDTYDGRAVALADLWNRGVLDVIVANQRGPLLVYKNTVVPQHAWIEFDLKGSGVGGQRSGEPNGIPDGKSKIENRKSNASAIGAQVQLTWSGQTQLQEVQGGSGFCAQNQRRLHFGLGVTPTLEKAVIRWPSGKTQTLTPTTTPALVVGKIIPVNEP